MTHAANLTNATPTAARIFQVRMPVTRTSSTMFCVTWAMGTSITYAAPWLARVWAMASDRLVAMARCLVRAVLV